jgi:hypothetical protein
MPFKLKQVQEDTVFAGTAGDWRFQYRMRRDTRGKLVIYELKVVRNAKSMREFMAPIPEGGISKALLRSLPLQEEVRYARSAIAHDTFDPPPRVRERKRAGRGRPELPITFYRNLGRRWNELVKTRDAHPAKSLAVELGRNRSTVRAMLRRYDDLAHQGRLVPRAPAER